MKHFLHFFVGLLVLTLPILLVYLIVTNTIAYYIFLGIVCITVLSYTIKVIVDVGEEFLS